VTPPTVDVHAHVLLPEVDALVADLPGFAAAREVEARRNGPAALAVSGTMVRERVPRLTDVSVRLAAMDAQGVDVQLVSPSPSHYHYWADEETAEKVHRRANEATAAHCAQAPGRLFGLGLVPLQHPALAVRALEHALEQGLLGVEISSHAPGRELSDPAYEPFWSRAEETGALLFLHPFGCTLDERLDRWYLSNTVGQPTENAVALSHLIFSGVLDRHPEDEDGFLRLGLIAEVNGEVVGEDLLSNMGWTFEEMVAYASRGTWVRPGDVLGSGTCGNGGCLAELWGVRGTQDPSPLRPGDTVTLTVEGIGSVSNTVVAGADPLPVPAARRRTRERP
jgi:predicted TIM-barrel fold metal-dependent hydrolase